MIISILRCVLLLIQRVWILIGWLVHGWWLKTHGYCIIIYNTTKFSFSIGNSSTKTIVQTSLCRYVITANTQVYVKFHCFDYGIWNNMHKNLERYKLWDFMSFHFIFAVNCIRDKNALYNKTCCAWPKFLMHSIVYLYISHIRQNHSYSLAIVQ